MKRARGVLAVAGMALTLVAGRVSAQAVTLPTIRTSKTPEMALLTQMVAAMKEPANQPSKLATLADTLRFKCEMAAMALTPYTANEVTEARRVGSTAAAAERAFRAASQAGTPASSQDTVLGRANLSGVARSLGKTLPTKPSVRVADGLWTILAWAPANCALRSGFTQDSVHQVVEPYREAETDKAKGARLDSLEEVAAANVVQRELRERRVRPVRSHDDAVEFWQQPSGSTLNLGAISGGNEQGATYTELGTRILHAFRFSFSAVIASGKDSVPPKAGATKEDSSADGATISRFLNGGGLLNVGIAYPLAHLGTPSGSGDFLGIFAPRFGGTLPVLGASARDTTLVYDLGTEFVFKSMDKVGGIGLYVQTRLGYAGGSPTFMRLIGDPNNRRTGYQTVTAGFTLDDRFVITMSKTVSGPRVLQQTGWQVGVSVARGASTPAGSK